MKKLLFILIVCCSLNVVGQENDTIKIFWNNGYVKYFEYSTMIGGMEFQNILVFDSTGVEISKEEYSVKYGEQFMDSITAYGMWKRNSGGNLSGKKFEYDNLIDKGDVAMYFKEYLNARDLFEQAILIFPYKLYPKEKIKEIDKLINVSQSRLQYDSLIKKGEVAFLQLKNYKEAYGFFEEATLIFPKEPYPKEMMKKLENYITN